MAPGMIVGQGRYVLAEKLADCCHRPSQAFQQLPQPPIDYLLLESPADSRQEQAGQLVPYEGLAKAIARELPQLPILPSPTPLFLPAVFDFSLDFLRKDPDLKDDSWGYRFGQRLGKGSFGEAWRAMALDGSMREVVLKRLFVEHGEHVRRSGEREIFFGTYLQNRPHIARFLHSFQHEVEEPNGEDGEGSRRASELWLVFHNEGFALTHYLFHLHAGTQIVELSSFWWLLKQQQPIGLQVIKNIAYQLLHALAIVHELNITHRDVKLGNVFMTETWPPVVRLGDWGSALVLRPGLPPQEVKALYPETGPSPDEEETYGYRPPEASFDPALLAKVGLQASGPWRPTSYDQWSFGVLLLELILGQRDIFQVDTRRWLRLEFEARQSHSSSNAVNRERFASRLQQHGQHLQGLLDLCLAPRTAPSNADLAWYFSAESWTGQLERRGAPGQHCTDEEFAEALRKRDAAGIGLPDAAGRDLLRRLMDWSPEQRITAREALAHPWFDDSARLPPLKAFASARRKSSENRGKGSTATGDARERRGQKMAEDTRKPTESSDICHGGSCESGQSRGQCNSEPQEITEEVSQEDEQSSKPPVGFAGQLQSGCPGLNLHVAVHSNIGRRVEMEDRHSVHNLSSAADSIFDAGFVGVFDGHGGNAVADYLRRELHRHVQHWRLRPQTRLLEGGEANATQDYGVSPIGDVRLALQVAFAAADNALLQARGRAVLASKSQDAVLEAGSTALVACATGCQLHLVNVGDCRAVAAYRGWPNPVGSDWPPGARVEIRQHRVPELRGQRGTVSELRGSGPESGPLRVVVQLHRNGELQVLKPTALRLLSIFRAVRLTEDHKPGSDAERKRIESLGGHVDMPDSSGREGGAPEGNRSPPRVAGLATSRSLGSFSARPFVSADPDLRSIHLHPPDARNSDSPPATSLEGTVGDRDGGKVMKAWSTEPKDLETQSPTFVVLASDGVWDVLEEQAVVDLVWDQLSSAQDPRLSPEAALIEAAQLIVQAALERGSLDNLTCAIILLSWI